MTYEVQNKKRYYPSKIKKERSEPGGVNAIVKKSSRHRERSIV
jgi:hypothetical protein